MIYLNDFFNLVNFKITGGSEYLWNCFGNNARFLDSEQENQDTSCIFDAQTQELYVLHFSHMVKEDTFEAYRWINPKYKEKYIEEHNQRNIDYTLFVDETPYNDFDNINDFIAVVDKFSGFAKYTTMSIELDDDLILELTKKAMELNLTIDVLVNNILREYIKHLEKQDPEIMKTTQEMQKNT
jgi:hypothetical protein